jgi:hypothetical protein
LFRVDYPEAYGGCDLSRPPFVSGSGIPLFRLTPLIIVAMLAPAAAFGSRLAEKLFPPDLTAPAAASEVLVGLRPAGAGLTDAMLEARLGGRIAGRMHDIGAVRLALNALSTLHSAVGWTRPGPGITIEP